MKRVLIILGNFILVFAAAACAVGAVISAFSFTVDTRTILWCWFTAALLTSALTTLWRGKALLALLLPAALLLVWNLTDILLGAKWVVSLITGEYSVWIDVPALFPDARPGASAQTYFFSALGVLLTYPLSVSICLRRSAPLTIFFTVPLVLLTFVLTTFQPNLWFILGLVAVVLTLIISGALHPDDYQKRGVAVFPAILLTAVLLTAAFLLTMADSSRRGDLVSFFDDRIRFIGVQAGFTKTSFGSGWPEIRSDLWQFDTGYVRVSSAGQRTITDRSLLDVSASHAGTYYLKGYAMQQFDGRAWQGNSEAQRDYGDDFLRQATSELALLYYVNNLQNGGSGDPDRDHAIVNMYIKKTGDHSDVAYLPYYSRSFGAYIPQQGLISGTDITDPAVLTGYDSYLVDLMYIDGNLPLLLPEIPPDTVDEYLSDSKATIRRLADRVYRSNTRVEDSTAEALRKIAFDAGIDPNADRGDIAEAVAAYISTAARYNLSPIPIPLDEDFALYFLQRSRQGYCIHFATAATLMLRALDIPARFATGFIVTVRDDETDEPINVTDRHAHAWVEVFYDDVGWVPLEVTPSAQGSVIPDRPQYVPSRQRDVLEEPENDYYREPRPGVTAGSSPTPSASPSEEPLTQEPDTPDTAERLPVVPVVVICAAACLLLMVLRWFLAQKHRQKLFSQADTNEAVLCVWRCVTRLLRKSRPPAEVEELALKARFSRHRISEAERAFMVDYAEKQRAAVFRSRRLPGRLWLKYILLR